MKYIFFVSLLVLGSVIAEPSTDEPQEEEYHTVAHKSGDEEEVTILDKDDHVVGIVDMFKDEGYQIDKPVDGEENVCLLRNIDNNDEEANDTDICYVRRAVSHEEAAGMNMSRILDHCGNRSIYILEPQDCDKIDNTATTGMSRQKRSYWPTGHYCCYYKRCPSLRCTRYTSRCCRWYRHFCIKRCTTCARYTVVYITVKTCYYG